MKHRLFTKAVALGVLAAVAGTAIPTPAAGGSDAGTLLCLITVFSEQAAARAQRTPAPPVAAPALPARPYRLPAPDLTLSALPERPQAQTR